MSEKITFPLDNPLVSKTEPIASTENKDHPDKNLERRKREAEEKLRKKREKEKKIRKDLRAEDGKGTMIDTVV